MVGCERGRMYSRERRRREGESLNKQMLWHFIDSLTGFPVAASLEGRKFGALIRWSPCTWVRCCLVFSVLFGGLLGPVTESE